MSSKDMTLLRCAGVQRFVDTYLDGEFGESEQAELEAHLSDCDGCRHKVKVQADWKAAIKAAAPRPKAPAALRNRIKRSIAKESAPPLSWRRWAVRVMPAAAAAGMLATFLVSRVSFSPVALDIVSKHQRNLPVEVTGGADQLRQWYRDKVDFPVKPPQLGKAALRGGRLANVKDRQAAYLLYDADGTKVSVFIFDPGDLPLEAHKKARIGNREVYLDQERGYNVAIYRDQGVGYAVASEMDPDAMLKLVSSAVSP